MEITSRRRSEIPEIELWTRLWFVHEMSRFTSAEILALREIVKNTHACARAGWSDRTIHACLRSRTADESAPRSGRHVVFDRKTRASREQQLDGIGNVFVGDVMVAALDAQRMSLHEHVHGREAGRRLELVAGELDLQAIRIVKINRVHEAAIALDELDAPGAKPVRRQHKGGSRDIERQVLDASNLAGCVPPRIFT